MNAQAPEAAAHDRVLRSTRVLAVIVVPILAVAFVMLFLFPDDTGLLFAWPIKPPMSAMMLGAAYLGGAYFFTLAATTRRWHSISLGFLPVTAFAAILGIATALYWDRFTHGHLSFVLWAVLYFTLPFVLPAVWLRNQRAARRDAAPSEPLLPRTLSWAFGVLGVVLIAASLLLLLLPEIMIPTWPWALNPLTARVLSAMFALPGCVELGVALDRRWGSARTPLQAQAVSIPLILLAMLRAQGDINWSKWESWLFVSGLLLVLAVTGWAALWSRKAHSTLAPGGA